MKSAEARSWINRVYYSNNALVRFAFLNKIKKFQAIIPKSHFKTALDVGTGIGIPLPSLIKDIGVSTLVATDIDSALLTEVEGMAKREGIYNNCALVRCDARCLPFRDNSFLLITSLDVLEHIRDLKTAIMELNRVLSHSGLLVVGYPTDNAFVKLAQKVLLGSDVGRFHVHDFSAIQKLIATYFSVRERTRLPCNLPLSMFRYELEKCTHKRVFQLNEHPLVSIIISNYNSGGLLNECLTSLSELDYPFYEIIVVDAGSNDGSPAIVKRFYPKVKLVREERIGIGEAINTGIKNASGEVIIFDYNTDEIASPDWLHRLIDVLSSSPDIGVVGGTRLVYGSEGIIDDAGAKILFFGHQMKTRHGKRSANCQTQPREVDYLGCIAVRRELLDKIGFVDETYFIYGEDADFCIRAKRKGYKIVHVPQAITYHKVSSTIGSTSARQMYFLRRAQMRLPLKLFSLPRMFIALIWVGFLLATDGLMHLPPFRKLVSFTPYSHLTNAKTLSHLQASVGALVWNLKNMRSTMAARSKASV